MTWNDLVVLGNVACGKERYWIIVMKNNKKKSVNLQKCKDKTSDSEFFFKENYETAKGHHSLVAFCILL